MMPPEELTDVLPSTLPVFLLTVTTMSAGLFLL
jgi:hypothetical protein